ncbi:hypothetical protein GB937_003344 [Aspergillus fischeri]|nr:hypothetical protein GB937_003344 [Aspergillus fischeri]
MTVSWNTYSQLPHPTVCFGRSPKHLSRCVSSNVSITCPTSTTYSNDVSIAGLEADTLYYYLPQHSNATTPYTFKTSRQAGDQTPYTVAVAIDMGLMGAMGLTTSVGKGAHNPLGPNDNNTIQSLLAQEVNTDFLWHRDNGGTTDSVHTITYNVGICMPGQTNFTGFRNHFRMPSAQSGGVENF